MDYIAEPIHELNILRKTDDRGIFTNVPVSEFKRMYAIQNHQINTVRGFHYHKEESLLLYCLKGVWKVIYYYDNDEKPTTKILSEGECIYLRAPAGNGHINLTSDAVLLCFATLSLPEVVKEEVKVPFDKFGTDIWMVKPR